MPELLLPWERSLVAVWFEENIMCLRLKFVRLKSSEKYFRIYWGQYFPFLWWGVCWGSLHHGGCDCSTQTLWFLQKLPPKLDCDAIEQDVEKLRRQQVVVSKKVLQLILQKHATFSEEFARLEQDSLSRTVITVLLCMYNVIHRRDHTLFYCSLANTLYVYCQILFLLKTSSK